MLDGWGLDGWWMNDGWIDDWWMDGWMDGWWVDVWLMDGQINDGWMGRRMMVGWMNDGWLDNGWMNGWLSPVKGVWSQILTDSRQRHKCCKSLVAHPVTKKQTKRNNIVLTVSTWLELGATVHSVLQWEQIASPASRTGGSCGNTRNQRQQLSHRDKPVCLVSNTQLCFWGNSCSQHLLPWLLLTYVSSMNKPASPMKEQM